MPGYPCRPSSAETAPSCICAARCSVMSSSCSVSLSPVTRLYCSARRSIPARSTGRPSSEKPAAPRAASSRHVDQLAALQAAADGGEEAGRHRGLLARRARSARQHGRACRPTGWVLGMARIATNPPAAAARVPEAMSSSSSSPGVRRCTCGSIRPGSWSARPRRSSRPRGLQVGPISAIAPSTTRTSSCTPSRPLPPSNSRAPEISRLAARRLAVESAVGITPPPARPARRPAGRPGRRWWCGSVSRS